MAGSQQQPVFDCAVHGTCTVERCMKCDDAEGLPYADYLEKEREAFMAHAKRVVHMVGASGRQSMAKENGWGWISLERMIRDVREHLLPKVAAANVHAIAGVPRSGMAAASALSTLLHLPLMSATHDGIREVGSGGRGRILPFGEERSRVLVLEDSTYSGGSLSRLARTLGDGHVYASVYHRPAARYKPDLYGVELESPHYFEWHFFNSGHMSGRVSHPGLQGGAVLDMDGIVCEEPRVPDRPEAAYVAWLESALPRWMPRTIPCRAILTARYSRYRIVTESWLAKHGVKYGELVMAEDRRDVAAWKAAELARLKASVYVESNPAQAEKIHQLWGGHVVCPPTEQMWRAVR